ncbi:hypothetical protein GZL_07495 [Streptomyces sp. 769]|nr:hypothetical protein GZL_07495 [Streptomyces sp. 769]
MDPTRGPRRHPLTAFRPARHDLAPHGTDNPSVKPGSCY